MFVCSFVYLFVGLFLGVFFVSTTGLIAGACQRYESAVYPGVKNTVKPRPEAHMDMNLFEVFLKNIHLIPQDQIVQGHYL